MKINEKSNEKMNYENKIHFVNDLIKGIYALENNMSAYLTPHEYDDQNQVAKDLKNRFARARLTNYTKSTFQKILSKLTNATIEFDRELINRNTRLLRAMENMDGNGQSLNQFVDSAIRKGLVQGQIPCLINYPQNDATILSESENILPVFNLIDQRDYFGSSIQKNNFSDVQSFVFTRSVSNGVTLNPESKEIKENIDTFFYVYYLKDNTLKVATFIKDKKSGNLSSLPEVDVVNSFVPVSFLNFNDYPINDFSQAPPLYELARNNSSLFRNQSTQTEILRTARLPLMSATGVDKSPPAKLTPQSWLSSENAQAKFSFVETTGNAADSGKDDIEIAKQEIESLMSGFFVENNVVERTATESIISESNQMSKVDYFADQMSKFLNESFNIANSFGNPSAEYIDFKFKVTINDDSFVNSENKNFLLKLHQLGALSRESLLKLGKTYNIIEENFDIDAELAKIQDEESSMSRDLITNGDS